MIPSLFPVFDPSTRRLENGLLTRASTFCEKSVHSKPECLKHYESMKSRGEGYYQCPFGMTSRNLYYAGSLYVITGVVAFPRFGTDAEQNMAKRFPEIKVAREAIEANVRAIREIECLRATAVQEAGQVLPQALHELRKLNGAVLQHAEKEIRERGETPGLWTIRSAAELLRRTLNSAHRDSWNAYKQKVLRLFRLISTHYLVVGSVMRNNFDILEALSNIEGMKALPTDATINLFDLTYKTKRIFEQRASAQSMQIQLDGIRAIIPGNQKSFPIVPAVLLENAFTEPPIK